MSHLLAEVERSPVIVVVVILVVFWVISGILNAMQKAAKEAENRQRAARSRDLAADIRQHGGMHSPSAEIRHELRPELNRGAPSYLSVGPPVSANLRAPQQQYQQQFRQEQLRQQHLRQQQIQQQQIQAAQVQREQSQRERAQHEQLLNEQARGDLARQRQTRAASARQAESVVRAERAGPIDSRDPSVTSAMERNADIARPPAPRATIAGDVGAAIGVRGISESTAAQFQGGSYLRITPQALRSQFILTEILAPPLALRAEQSTL